MARRAGAAPERIGPCAAPARKDDRRDPPHDTAVPRRSRRQFPAPEVPARRAGEEGPRRDHGRPSCAPSRTARSARSSGCRRTSACNRSPTASSAATYFHIDFLQQLGGVKCEDVVTIRRPDGTEELAPPVMRVVDRVRHVKDIQLADFEYLREPDGAHAESDDSVADDAAFPRRPRRHQQGALPGSRAVLPGRRRRLRRRAALARRRRLHLRADGRHQPRVPVRSEDAGGGARSAATTRASCRTAMRRSSTASSRRSPPA